MVPLLLSHLSVSDYILWSIFIAFGGLSLQLETSIQMLAVRDIARQYHSRQTEPMLEALRRGRIMYRALAGIVAVPMALAGGLYLLFGTAGKIGVSWQLEWGIFVAAYAVNYWYGINSALLLATDRVATFSLISGCTRLLNLSLTWVMLAMGYSVLGICLSFALSMLINVTFIWQASKRSPPSPLDAQPDIAELNQPMRCFRVTPNNLYAYTLFIFVGYIQYRGGILLATRFFEADQVASYALALQAFGMIATLSVVPIQAWLARLVGNVVANNLHGLIRELRRTMIAVNLLFLSCTLALLLGGDAILSIIGSRLQLPPKNILALVAIAFFLEANILTLINVFITRNNYGFIKPSLFTITLALTGMLTAAVLGAPLSITMLAIPVTIHAIVSLPLLVHLLAKQLDTSIKQLLSIMIFNAQSTSPTR